MYSMKAFLLLMLCLSPAVIHADPGLKWGPYIFHPPEYFVLRNQAAVDTFEDLDEKAREIDSGYRVWEQGDEKRISFFTDFHAVYPLKIERFIPIFLEHENEDVVFPGMNFTRDLSKNLPPTEPHFQEVLIAFGFLSIEVEYHYIVYRVPTWYPDGSFSLHWALVHSFGGDHAKLFGSWYVKPVEKNGKAATYVRNYVQTEMINPPLFTKSLVNLLGQSNVRDYFDALYRAARTGYD